MPIKVPTSYMPKNTTNTVSPLSGAGKYYFCATLWYIVGNFEVPEKSTTETIIEDEELTVKS